MASNMVADSNHINYFRGMTSHFTESARLLRLAARSLRHSPSYALAVVASLAISIAAITTVFSIASAVLFDPLPFRDPERLVWMGSVRTNRNDGPFTLPEYMDYAAGARTVDLAAFTQWNAAMATPSVARRLQGMRISANAFRVLGVLPSAGRLLRDDDDERGAPRIVLLSRAFWIEEFGGDVSAVGRVLQLNDEPHEIVGVLPAHFPLPLPGVQVVVPLHPDEDARRHLRSSTNFLLLFGRLRPGSAQSAAAEDLNVIARSMKDQFPADYASKLGVALSPMKEYLVGRSRLAFIVMLGASALLLMIALANVLNLVLVRSIAKRGETAVRRALGGTGRQLMYGAVSEALILSVTGAVVGSLLAKWAVALAAGSSIGVLRLQEAELSGRVIALVSLIGILGTLLVSVMQLVAGLRATPVQALSAMGRGLHGSRAESRLRGMLLVSQLAFAVLITILTGTMAQSLARLQSVPLGYEPDSVLVARLALPPQKYATIASMARTARELETELQNLPGVVSAGAISIAPLTGGLSIIPFSVAGRAPASESERLEAHLRDVTPGYFEAVDTRVISGRTFTVADDENGSPVAIVSQALASRYFPDTDPIGRQLLVDDNNTGPRPLTIVGVVGNMRHVRLDAPPEVDIYIPFAQVHQDGAGFLSARQFWVAKLRQGAIEYPRAFASVLERVDRDIAMGGIEPMRRHIDASLAPRRVSVYALVGFALTALTLAVVGVYGVVAYSVAQRRREVGLRLALGATRINVARTFVQPAIALGAVGVTLGVAGALATRRVVAGLLFGVSPTEPLVLVAVASVLLGATGVAAFIPARRATRIDPATTLRD